ncbi:hypothetical protein O0555_15645 [Brevibacillus laterosporus]|uniref:hypothetical protein n=1 Tax=Brevibacillus laterosporus TaxID=1465 RepID=UPI0018F8700F|nr:hypothetical protein [Brevibacillus laterosporus]MBG9774243.1 hypothetical protein [Brevibacillus laterosporus]MCR8938767.1 hypothetical protein [Brevibacillus laterosporus]MCR8997987.1 hypothetical protein [Brevibacillus laterosporus]MCZ0841407.1 hypothetical protein [Brevibacillus laterosporus]MCZ0847727.1 hypothetical protein [Brevibacillus laterosporus]
MKITFQEWTYACSEPGCCDDYGTRLIIGDQVITEYAEISPEELRTILRALGVDCVVEELEEGTE